MPTNASSDNHYWVVENHHNKIVRTPFDDCAQAEAYKSNLPENIRSRTTVHYPLNHGER